MKRATRTAQKIRFNNRDDRYLFRDTLLKLVKAEKLPYEKLTQAA
jgi:hypothetical protein